MTNVVSNIDGANVTLNDQVLATEVGQPMFFRYGQLLNTALTFTPIIIVVAMFWLVYDAGKRAVSNTSLSKKKDLNNK